MAALLRHLPPPWLRSRRRPVPAAGSRAEVLCLHHAFREIQLGDGGMIRMFECKGCGRLLWWERATRQWHEDREEFEQVPYVELTEDMVVEEEYGQERN